MMKIPMTLFEKKYLEEELLKLISIERPSVQEALHEARALGDLKENADYHANKEKQALLEGRILEIQGKLAQGEVIDISKTSSSTIVFGATVTLFDCSKNKEVVYTIVGEALLRVIDEWGPLYGKALQVWFSRLGPAGQLLIEKIVLLLRQNV